MIQVTRLNDSKVVINAERIQSLQSTPDTVITFIDNDRMIVKEHLEELSEKILTYQRFVNSNRDGGSDPLRTLSLSVN